MTQDQERLLPNRTANHSFWRTEHFDSFSLEGSPTALSVQESDKMNPRRGQGRKSSLYAFFKKIKIFKVKKTEMAFSVAPHRSLDKSELFHLVLMPSRFQPLSTFLSIFMLISQLLSTSLSLFLYISSPNNSCQCCVMQGRCHTLPCLLPPSCSRFLLS